MVAMIFAPGIRDPDQHAYLCSAICRARSALAASAQRCLRSLNVSANAKA
jgi:hypothetical protein